MTNKTEIEMLEELKRRGLATYEEMAKLTRLKRESIKSTQRKVG